MRRETNGGERSSGRESRRRDYYHDPDLYDGQDAYDSRNAYGDRGAYDSRNAYGDRGAYDSRNAYGDRRTYDGGDFYENRSHARSVSSDRYAYESQRLRRSFDGENVYGERSAYDSRRRDDRRRSAYDSRRGDDRRRSAYDSRRADNRRRDDRGRSGGRRDYYEQDRRAGMPGMYKKRKKHRALKFVLELLLVLFVAVGVFFFATLGRIDKQRLGSILQNAGVTKRSGYTTFVLYGVDSREGKLTESCHSDTIMLCSMNRRTKEIKLVSVYRDTYLDNTNGEYRKATECYFYGGPERSVNMLNKNLDLDIQDYMAVNFNAVVKVIDLLGGIDLEITAEEMEYINGYCVENEQVTGVGYTPLYESGYVHLDGIQALAYCRIRYTEGWDYKRTERQRTVLTLVMEKAKKQSVPTLLSIANTMLPSISTSMGTVELLELVAGLGGYKLSEQTGFPFDKAAANIAAGDCVVPVNLSANVTQLHEFLFGESGYIPSETVQGISSEIANTTGIY